MPFFSPFSLIIPKMQRFSGPVVADNVKSKALASSPFFPSSSLSTKSSMARAPPLPSLFLSGKPSERRGGLRYMKRLAVFSFPFFPPQLRHTPLRRRTLFFLYEPLRFTRWRVSPLFFPFSRTSAILLKAFRTRLSQFNRSHHPFSFGSSPFFLPPFRKTALLDPPPPPLVNRRTSPPPRRRSSIARTSPSPFLVLSYLPPLFPFKRGHLFKGSKIYCRLPLKRTASSFFLGHTGDVPLFFFSRSRDYASSKAKLRRKMSKDCLSSPSPSSPFPR